VAGVPHRLIFRKREVDIRGQSGREAAAVARALRERRLPHGESCAGGADAGLAQAFKSS
jgi:hypothetical protein